MHWWAFCFFFTCFSLKGGKRASQIAGSLVYGAQSLMESKHSGMMRESIGLVAEKICMRVGDDLKQMREKRRQSSEEFEREWEECHRPRIIKKTARQKK